MKTFNIKFFAAVSMAFLVALGCKKIEITPDGITDPANAFNDESDVKAMLNSAYGAMTDGRYYGGRLQLVSEYLADQGDGSRLSGYEADIYNFKSSADAGTYDNYVQPYIIIQRANTVLENLNLVTSSPAVRNKYEGEARFLRALSHFDLVKLFAQPYGYTADNSHPGVIIKTNSAYETDLPRNTVKEVYDTLLNDLRLSQNLLPDANGPYATKWAAKAILARVYFQMNKFDSAYHYSNDVIENGPFTFDDSPDYIWHRFDSATTVNGFTPKSTEAIFYLVNDPNIGVRFGGLRGGNPDVMSLNYPITQATYTAGTAAADVRRNWYVSNSGVYSINKYKNAKFILPVIHLTELKLIRAESAAELNQHLTIAAQDINDILDRAYGGTRSISSSASADIIRDNARQQRKLEMIFETGDRLQQIKRIGAKGETSFSGPAPWNCNGLVLQFPASQVSVNPSFEGNPQGGCTR